MEPISTALITYFTTANVISAVIGGCLGNRADEALTLTGKTILKRLIQNADQPENHDVQRAVRHAYLSATFIACKHLMDKKYDSVHALLTSQPHSDLARLIKYLRKEIKNINTKNWTPKSSVMDQEYDFLIKPSGKKAQERLPELISKLREDVFDELKFHRQRVEPDLKNIIENGWQQEGVNVKWFELICAFFKESLKKPESRVRSIIQMKYLADLNETFQNNKLEWAPIEERLDTLHEQYSFITSKLEQILDLLEQILIELGPIKEDVKITKRDVRTTKTDVKTTKEDVIAIRETTDLIEEKTDQGIDQGKKLLEGQDGLGEKFERLEKTVLRKKTTIDHIISGEPPVVPEHFMGRSAELEEIHRWLATNNFLMVSARGGLGKTSLTAKYFRNHQQDYKHVAWLVNSPNILEALLNLSYGLAIEKEEGETQAQRFQKVLAALANLPTPSLLVIDNVNDPDELDSHYDQLRNLDNLKVVLTTRTPGYRQAKVLPLGSLSENESLQLFRIHYPGFSAEDEEVFKSIRTAVNENTLVLELLAKNLRAVNLRRRNQAYTLTDLLTDLQEKGLLGGLSQSKKVHLSYQHYTKEEPETVIAAMYDLQNNTDEELEILSAVAVLPPESIPYENLELLLTEIESYDDHLDNLILYGWIEDDQRNGSLKMSPVVQEIIRTKNAESLMNHCQPLIGAFNRELDFKRISGEADESRTSIELYELFETLIRYAEGMLAHFQDKEIKNTNDEYQGMGWLCFRMAQFHDATGNLDAMLRASHQMGDIFKELTLVDSKNVSFKNGLAISCSKLGDTHTALGNLQKALEYFDMETQLFEELFEAQPKNVSFKNGLAISYSKLGDTHTALGNLQKALEYFEKDTKLTKELFEAQPKNVSFKNGLAISYEKLGHTHTALGNLQKALDYFEQRSAIGKELFEAQPKNVSFKNGLAISYAKLGVFCLDHKKNGNEQAKEHFFQAKQLWAELTDQFPDYVEFQRNHDWAKEKLKGLENL